MGKANHYNGIQVIGLSKEDFERIPVIAEDKLYLIDRKYLVGVKGEACFIMGQAEPDGSVFEYAEKMPYKKKSIKKKTKTKMPVKEKEKEVKDDVDSILRRAIEETIYEDILF